jgi:hypothetical protein
MPRSLRALAADIEGRHRLISEVCNHSSPSLRTRVCVCWFSTLIYMLLL